MNRTRILAGLCSAISALLLTACGGGNSTNATVGGSVTGLAAGTSVTLTLNNANAMTVNANSSFTFPVSLGAQAAYNVLVSQQPTGQTCLVSEGSGLISYSGDSVNNVAVTCVQNVAVGGNVTGLTSGSSLQLQNNGVNLPAAITANGSYSFLEPLGALYSVTINVQPTGLVCTVSNPSGGVSSLQPITNLNIACVPAP